MNTTRYLTLYQYKTRENVTLRTDGLDLLIYEQDLIILFMYLVDLTTTPPEATYFYFLYDYFELVSK